MVWKWLKSGWGWVLLISVSTIISLLVCIIFKQLDKAFINSFLSNWLATILGAVLGIPIALGVDRANARRAGGKRAQELLDMYTETLNNNLGIIEEIKKQIINEQDYTFQNIDIQLLEATSALKYEVIEDLQFNKILDSARFELRYLSRLLERFYDFVYGVETTGFAHHAKRLTSERALIQISEVQNTINEVLTYIDG